MRTGFTIPGGLMLGLLDSVTGDTVAITANRATVAQWRQARTEAIYRDDIWGLQVFKAATVFLEEAERYGLADDDILLQRLANHKFRPGAAADPEGPPGVNRASFAWSVSFVH